MSGEVQQLEVVIAGEMASYISDLKKASEATAATLKAMLDLAEADAEQTKASREAAAAAREEAAARAAAEKAAREHQKAMKELGADLKVLGAAGLAAAGGVYELVQVANSVNPQGANEYAEAMSHLRDEATTAAAHLGEQFRPVVMAVIGVLTQMADFLAHFRFDKLWADLKRSGTEVIAVLGDALDWVKSTAYDIAVGVAQTFSFPLQLLQDGFTGALSGLLDFASGALQRLGSLVDALGLGQKFKAATGIDLSNVGKQLAAAAAAAREEGSKRDIGKQAIEWAAQLGKGAAGGVVDGIKAGLKTASDFWKGYEDPSLKTLHAFNGNDQAQAQLRSQLAEIAAKRAEWNTKDQQTAFIIAEIQNKAQQQQEANALKSAEDAAQRQHEILQDAYSHGLTTQIEGAQKQYDLAVEAVRAQEQQRLRALGDQKAALATQVVNLELAARHAENAFKQAQDLQAKADAAAARQGAGAREKSEAEAATKAAQAAEAIASHTRERYLAVAQKAAEIGLAYDQLGADIKAKVSKEDYERQKELLDRKRAAEQAGLQGFDRLTGLGGLRGAYASASASGFANIGADQKMDLGPLGSASTAGFIGVIVELLAQSKQIQQAMGYIKELVQSVSDVLGAFAQPWVDILHVLSGSLAPMLEAFVPAIAAFAELVSPVVMLLKLTVVPLADMLRGLGQVVSAVAPLLPPLVELAGIFLLLVSNIWQIAIVAELLGMALSALAPVLQGITDSIATVWNGLIQRLTNWLRSFDDVPVLGTALDRLAGMMDGLAIPMNTLTASATSAAVAIDQMAQQIANERGGAINAAERANALQAAANVAAQDAAAHPGDSRRQAEADALAKAATDAAKEATRQRDQYSVDYAQQQLDQAKAQGHGPGSAEYGFALMALGAALSQQALDNADNTQATKDNTKAVNAVSGILNSPSGFKLEGYTFGAIGAQSAIDRGAGQGAMSFAGGRQAQAPQVTIVVQVAKSNASPEDIGKAVKKVIEDRDFRSTGTVAGSIGSRWANAGLGR